MVTKAGEVFGWGHTGLNMGLGLFTHPACAGSQFPLLAYKSPNKIGINGVAEAKVLPNGTTIFRKNDGTVWILAGVISSAGCQGQVDFIRVSDLGSVISLGDPISSNQQISPEFSMIPVVEASGAVRMLEVTSAYAAARISSGGVDVLTAKYYVSEKLNIPPIKKISCARQGSGDAKKYHCLAITHESNVISWGVTPFGNLGDGSLASGSEAPVVVKILSNIVDVAVAPSNSFALSDAGVIYSWGGEALLGRADSTVSIINPTPTQIPGIPPITEIVVSTAANDASGASGNHVLALTKDGSIYGWGLNSSGALGSSGIGSVQKTPTKIIGVDLH